MNYRIENRNLKRSEIKIIKRKEAEERNAKYQALPLEEKKKINPKKAIWEGE